MKFRWKNLTLEHYIRRMRKESKHIQHMHAIVFAGTITVLIAVFLLYSEYGFWHETYVSDELVVEQARSSFDPESPGESFARFWEEAKEKFGSIGSTSGRLLEGRETYTKEE